MLTAHSGLREIRPPGTMKDRPTTMSLHQVPRCCRLTGARSGALLGCALAGVIVLAPQPAAADFRLCNNTTSRVGISLGYKENDGWSTEGWWNLPPRTCETLMRGPLVARYYYIYAVDYDRNGEWSGQAYMCTRDKEFTIRGTEDCLARGFDRTGFFEVDTGEQPSWTVQLTESAEAAPQQPLQSRAPVVPPPVSGRPPAQSPRSKN
jgi:uncharacterized membrane protein